MARYSCPHRRVLFAFTLCAAVNTIKCKDKTHTHTHTSAIDRSIFSTFVGNLLESRHSTGVAGCSVALCVCIRLGSLAGPSNRLTCCLCSFQTVSSSSMRSVRQQSNRHRHNYCPCKWTQRFFALRVCRFSAILMGSVGRGGARLLRRYCVC